MAIFNGDKWLAADSRSLDIEHLLGEAEPDGIKDAAQLEEYFQQLSSINSNGISELKARIILAERLGIFPRLFIGVPKGYRFYRARINHPETLFHSERDISYRDSSTTTYGRASCPGVPVWYGVIDNTGQSSHTLSTLIYEVAQILSIEQGEIPDDFFLTVGTWVTKTDLNISHVVFNDALCERYPFLQTTRERYAAEIEEGLGKERAQYVEKYLEFITKRFSAFVTDNRDYLWSAVYADLLFRHSECEGIIYPSVNVTHGGLNIAIPSLIVERKLQLTGVRLLRVRTVKNRTLAEELKHVQQFGHAKSRFIWSETQHASSDVIAQFDLAKQLWLNSD